MAPYNETPNSIVFCILGLLRERGLLEAPLSKWKWRAQFKKTGINGENWLPYYESVRRGWTKDTTMVKAVNADPILKSMLSNNVTFLEDRILDATELNIRKRIFRDHREREIGEFDKSEDREFTDSSLSFGGENFHFKIDVDDYDF